MLDTVVPASSAPYGFYVGCVGLMCRHELSTDKHSNESRKEREAQEAEDREGRRQRAVAQRVRLYLNVVLACVASCMLGECVRHMFARWLQPALLLKRLNVGRVGWL
jgi:hypothetical protein